MPTFDPTFSTGQSVPGGGMTLEEIMQRRRDLARTQLGFSQVATPTIAGGLGNMISAFTTGLQEHQAQQQEAQGRQAFGQAMASFDPTTGTFKDPNALATIAMLDPQQAASMSANMYNAAQQMAMEKQRETYEAGLPQTPRAKAIADYNSGKFGTVGSKEAQDALQAAIRASEAPELSVQDRAYLDQQKADYIRTGSSLQALTDAKGILDKGIDTGYWSAVKQGLTKWGLPPPGTDAEQATRTEQFNAIMEQQGAILTDTISKVLGPASAAAFINTMTGPADVATKQKALNDIIIQVKSFNDSQRANITRTDPNALPEVGKQAGAPPKPGDVVDGYRFKGGDPSDQKNWEKV